MTQQTLLVVLAHPDDEVTVAGTILAQRARGDRVFLLWLTRGEMTEAFGTLPPDKVAAHREALGIQAARMLDVEHHFMDFPDTGVHATPEAARRVAAVVADVGPDGILTWGDAWVRGQRHPDHHATGRIARDAVTLARISRVVAPRPAHRKAAPVFTLRGSHSTLPVVGVDVERYLSGIFELADFYRRELGFGERAWVERRLRVGGRLLGVEYGEAHEAWETSPGKVPALLPADPGDTNLHPGPRE